MNNTLFQRFDYVNLIMNRCPNEKTMVKVEIKYDFRGLNMKILPNNVGEPYYDVFVTSTTECSRVPPKSYVFTINEDSFFVQFVNETDAKVFHDAIATAKKFKFPSISCSRTDEISTKHYFPFYGILSHEENELENGVRTDTYGNFLKRNCDDFKDKTVLIVCAGTGSMAFFVAAMGARKVYALEGVNQSKFAKKFAETTNLEDEIVLIPGKIEEVVIPESVDVIISEQMGYWFFEMLFNARTLDSFLYARKWLAPEGKMFPSQGDIHIAPFSNENLYREQYGQADFWNNRNFNGIDVRCLQNAALKEYFRQPIVDNFDDAISLSESVCHRLDFSEIFEKDLHHIEIPLKFKSVREGACHGLVFWSDMQFIGSNEDVSFTTGPNNSLRHWYQIGCLFEKALNVQEGEIMVGHLSINENNVQSYDVSMELQVKGIKVKATLDLRNPYYRYIGSDLPTFFSNMRDSLCDSEDESDSD